MYTGPYAIPSFLRNLNRLQIELLPLVDCLLSETEIETFAFRHLTGNTDAEELYDMPDILRPQLS